MSTLLSTADLLELELANLPKTRQGIEKRAKKEGWAFEIIAGQGRGGKLKKFLLSGLPADVQAAIREKQAAELLAKAEVDLTALPVTQEVQCKKKGVSIVDAAAQAKGLSDKQQEVSQARAVFASEVLRLQADGGLSRRAAAAKVAQKVQLGLYSAAVMALVPIANARANGQRAISWRSLFDWANGFASVGSVSERLVVLAPKKSKETRSLFDVVWLADWLAVWCHGNCLSMAEAYRVFARVYGEKYGVEAVPSLQQVGYVNRGLPELVKQRGRVSGSAYKRLLPYVKRDWLVFNPNDIWVGDGHGFKAKVAHPIHGQPFQPEITAIIDAATRYVVGWSVSLAESTIAHADALRHAMSRHEPPLMYYTDNGAGPTGKMLDADITGILPRYGIEHATGLPGNPQGRGIIERLWETVTMPLAQSYETFVGKRADEGMKTLKFRKLASAMRAEAAGRELSVEQKRYRNEVPSFGVFLADLAAAFERYNLEHAHSELAKATQGEFVTPSAYREWRLSQLGVHESPLGELELDLMFRPEEIRKVNRGLVSLFGNSYFSQELAAVHGEQVRVGYDLHDASYVFVKKMDGKFLCKAKFEGHVQAAFAVSRIEQLREQRVRNAIKRQEEKIALAEAELKPAIEQQPDFGQLMYGNVVIDCDYEVVEESQSTLKPVKRYSMFESDFEVD